MSLDIIPKEIECFSSVNSKIRDLLDMEQVKMSEEFFKILLTFLSGACTYEEEGVKIKPNILLGYNFDEYFSVVGKNYNLCIFEDDTMGTNFKKKMKALIPFCKNEWLIYINIKCNKIQYGIFRSYSGIKGFTTSQILFEDENLKNDITNAGILSLEVRNNHEIQLIGLRGARLIIDFSLIHNNSENIGMHIENLVCDIVSNHELSNREDLKVVYKKIFNAAYKKLHGAICLVVKDNYSFPNDTLSDGIWLDKPIKLSDIALQLLEEKGDNLLSEEYYSLTGVLIEMLNIDGITIIDDRGYIRGYNVFVTKSKNGVKKEVVGGARKRAFQTLVESGDPMLIGVYFQSQDGNVYYERVKLDEQ